MKFGIMLPHYRQVASTEGIRRVALEAEAMGYHSVWVSEHIVVPYEAEVRFGKGYYDPFGVLAYVSAITERVLLGTSIIVLPLRDPLHLAQMAATVDQLSGGRLILGVGVGSTEEEFRAMGARWEERGAVTDEAIQVLKHVWTTEKPDFPGQVLQLLQHQLLPGAGAAAPPAHLGRRRQRTVNPQGCGARCRLAPQQAQLRAPVSGDTQATGAGE